MQDSKIKVRWEAPIQAREKWNPDIVAADDSTISILSTIGEYGDGSGMTAKIVSGILRKAEGDITVSINSPGGDFFEGLAIHTLLKEYPGKVKVKVIGLAASAASIIAMAGDEILMAPSAFMMVHNSWTIAMGNASDMEEVAAMLSKFDESMAGLYAARTGQDVKAIKKIMNGETWLQGPEALEGGFATALLGSDPDVAESEEKEYNAALRKIDIELAKAGMPRSQRRDLIKQLTTPSTPCAANPATPCAGSELVDALAALHKTLKP